MVGNVAALLLTPLLIGGEIVDPPAAAAVEDAAPVAWRIDTSHSELSFRIRHLVSRVRGTFQDWHGTIVMDPDNLAGSSVEVTIQTASIDTGNDRRDAHLRSADFFDAENHPVMTFKSTAIEVNGNDLRITGDLTIRGVTRPVVLEGEFLGITADGQGRRRAGFEAETKIDRQEFGVSWNRAAEGGGVVLGDEVTISIVVAAVEAK